MLIKYWFFHAPLQSTTLNCAPVNASTGFSHRNMQAFPPCLFFLFSIYMVPFPAGSGRSAPTTDATHFIPIRGPCVPA